VAVQFIGSGIPLFKSSGVPAMNVNCCCGDDTPCVAIIPPCRCVDRFTPFNLIDADLFITIPPDFSTCPDATNLTNPSCTPVPGADLSGTYVVECDAEVTSRNGKFVRVFREFTFLCSSRFGVQSMFYDFYHVEIIDVIFQIPGSNFSGGAAGIEVRYSTGVVVMLTGDDPFTDTPYQQPSAYRSSRRYFYRLPLVATIDDCGNLNNARFRCGECELFFTSQVGTFGCTSATSVGDYAPSLVIVGG
jgi:hypothetical protein